MWLRAAAAAEAGVGAGALRLLCAPPASGTPASALLLRPRAAAATGAALHSRSLKAARSALRQPSSARSQWVDARGYEHFDGGGGGPRSWWRRLSTNRFAQAAGVTGAIAWGSYYYSSLEEIPYTHRRHAMMFVSKEKEKALGQAMYEMTRREAAASGRLLPPAHPLSTTVRRVGMRVAKAAAEGHGGGVFVHMRDVEWEFSVVANPVPNAFVVPGGKVVVHTGLLDLLSHEDELGAVLAHETGHVLARHHAERISSFNLWGVIKILAWVLFGIGLPNAAFALGIFLPYSRFAEYEADAIGLQLMAQACFEPKHCVSMLRKLHEKEKQQPLSAATPAFLRTHPLTDERAKRVRDALPAAYKTYASAGCAGVAAFFQDVLPEISFG